MQNTADIVSLLNETAEHVKQLILNDRTVIDTISRFQASGFDVRHEHAQDYVIWWISNYLGKDS